MVELLEHLSLPESVSALANPKSSTGRLDVFTRLIADHSDMFDSVPGGYQGKIYTEISPCSFSIRVRKGSRLNQIRFRRRNAAQAETAKFALSDRELLEQHKLLRLVDGDIQLRNGLVLSVDLDAEQPAGLVGYRAQKFTGVIDVDSIAEYDPRDFWEQVHVRNYNKLILDPNQFYILASRERIHIPPDWAAEMVPIDPMMGEFRVHYAGFFDPGLRLHRAGPPRQPRGAGGAQPRGAVRAGGRPGDRPPDVRADGGDPRHPLRPDRDLELPGPGPEALQAFPRVADLVMRVHARALPSPLQGRVDPRVRRGRVTPSRRIRCLPAASPRPTRFAGSLSGGVRAAWPCLIDFTNATPSSSGSTGPASWSPGAQRRSPSEMSQ